MTHRKTLRKVMTKLDKLYRVDPKKYRKKEIALNKKLRSLGLK